MIRSILLLLFVSAVIANAQYTDWKSFSKWSGWDSDEAVVATTEIDSGLLENWSFELWSNPSDVDFDTWVEGGEGSGDVVGVDSVDVPHGSYAAQIIRANDGCYVAYTLDTQPEDGYSLSFRVKDNGRVYVYDQTNSAFILAPFNVGTHNNGEYIAVDTSFSCPVGCIRSYIRFYDPAASDTVWFDSVTVRLNP